MLTTILVSLMCTINSTALLDPDDRIPIDPTREVWRALQLPEWPDNLPPLYVTPQDATCLERLTGSTLGEGIWLPTKRGDFEAHLLEIALDFPRRMQERLDLIRTVEMPALVNAELRRHLGAARARWLRETVPEAQGSFQDWLVGILIIGAALTGALLSVGAYTLMHKG